MFESQLYVSALSLEEKERREIKSYAIFKFQIKILPLSFLCSSLSPISLHLDVIFLNSGFHRLDLMISVTKN